MFVVVEEGIAEHADERTEVLHRLRNAAADHASGALAASYRHHCAREDGSRKFFDEVLARRAACLVRTQGIDEEAGGKMAASMMAKLPAWRLRSHS